jgi:hypothetical protein
VTTLFLMPPILMDRDVQVWNLPPMAVAERTQWPLTMVYEGDGFSGFLTGDTSRVGNAVDPGTWRS